MAHECPNCGLQCYCNGDLDDMCLNIPEAVNRCTHCPDDEEVDDFESDNPDKENNYVNRA